MSEAVGETGMVLAVEPVPPLAKRLASKARHRGMVQLQVVEAALGQTHGSAPFAWVRRAATRSGLRARPDMTPAWRSSIERIDVSLRRLDDLAGELKLAPRFIKLDLEGGEFGALRGASATLRKSRPMIVFENGGQSSADLYGYSREEWFALFESAGYSVYTLFGQAFSRENWGTPGLPWYFLAVPAEGPERQFLGKQLAPLILDVETWWRRSFQAFGRRWAMPTVANFKGLNGRW
ncbi:MAG: FkbM family methyltransferase [Proteobacteria bacterium]|nr:FkbM family methyltransferase [Pseudomonadota bacterium]